MTLFKARALLLLAAGTLVAVLAVPAEGVAQHKKGPPPDKIKKAREAAREEMVFKEAEALRQALAYLLVADKDYDGHRVKAVKQVQDALGILDGEVKRKGTAQQKEATAAEEKLMGQLKKAARGLKPVHEGQPLSDAQLGAAGKLLANVHTALKQDKRKKPLMHVANAVREIEIALKVR